MRGVENNVSQPIVSYINRLWKGYSFTNLIFKGHEADVMHINADGIMTEVEIKVHPQQMPYDVKRKHVKHASIFAKEHVHYFYFAFYNYNEKYAKKHIERLPEEYGVIGFKDTLKPFGFHVIREATKLRDSSISDIEYRDILRKLSFSSNRLIKEKKILTTKKHKR